MTTSSSRQDLGAGSPTPEDKQAAGTSLLDILPIPTTTQPVTDPNQHEKAKTLAEEPTLSHALAMEDQEDKGAAQIPHDHEVVNLGWNEPKEDIDEPLVGGLKNEDFWLLVRRFNKQVYHIREVPDTVPGDLDLNISDNEEFSPDKLRANVERLYMTVIIGILAGVKHVVRLRSWREARRTSYFCAVSLSPHYNAPPHTSANVMKPQMETEV